MVATVDYRGTVPRTGGDIRRLQPYLKQLVGQPFLFARESYGAELTLHFGREVDSPAFRGRISTEGTHILTLRASVWWLNSAAWASFLSGKELEPGPGVAEVPLADLEARPPVGPGSRVVAIEVAAFHGSGWPGGIELGLHFSDESHLRIKPRFDPADPVHDLADRELFTPYKRYVKAGPGVQWEYSPSDLPPSGDRP